MRRRRWAWLALLVAVLATPSGCGRHSAATCTADDLVDADGTSYTRDPHDGCKFKDADGHPPQGER
jgi:hypothetical protein